MLETQLKQAGYELADLEVELTNPELVKTAAGGVMDVVKSLWSPLKVSGGVAAGATALAGAGLGYGAYRAYKGYTDTSDEIDTKKKENLKIQDANKVLVDHLKKREQNV